MFIMQRIDTKMTHSTSPDVQKQVALAVQGFQQHACMTACCYCLLMSCRPGVLGSVLSMCPSLSQARLDCQTLSSLPHKAITNIFFLFRRAAEIVLVVRWLTWKQWLREPENVSWPYDIFQALIKAYGRKRLKEIEDHKRKKLNAKMAKRKANSNPNSATCSPVHQMMNASTDLLQRVIQLGRKQSISADNIHVLGKAVSPKADYKSTLKPDGTTLLQRVTALGVGNTRGDSENQPDRLTPNSLKPPDLFVGRSALSCNDLPITDDDFESDSSSSTPHNSPSRTLIVSSKGWGLLKRGSKGNVYQAVDTEGKDDVDAQVSCNPPDSTTPMSCDQVAVVIDTEESDLEMTPGSPGHVRTPLLPKPPPEEVEPQSESISSPPSHANPPGHQQLPSADEALLHSSVISDDGKLSDIYPAWKQKLAGSSSAVATTRGNTTLSFENPSYAGVMSDSAGLISDNLSAAGLNLSPPPASCVAQSGNSSIGSNTQQQQQQQQQQQRPSTLPISPTNNCGASAMHAGEDTTQACGNPNLSPPDPSPPSSSTVAKSTRLTVLFLNLFCSFFMKVTFSREQRVTFRIEN